MDWLETHLDDHEIDGDDVASDHFLSRHHFDRVRRATAGEPPARMRRRVLLERAAFRLATSQTGILDIAVEAGYSSNEAFTRAFQRAYGRSPSDWRRNPRRFQISAPSDIHFHPPGALRLPARHEGNNMTSDTLLTRMVEHHTWLVGELIDRASRLDDNQLDAPIELSVEGIDDDPTTRRLLSRLVGQMDMWNNVMLGDDYDWSIEEHETITSIRHRSREAGEAFLAEVHQVVEEDRLDETFIDAHCEPPDVFSYGGLIAHVLNFAAVRRRWVLGALASAGVGDLGAGDPRKWVVAGD